MSIENQFGLFDNNLEKFDPDLKDAFSECLAEYDAEKQKDPDRKIDEWFLVEIISKLIKKRKISVDDSENIKMNIHSDLKSDVEKMLNICGIKHSFQGGERISGLDIPEENKKDVKGDEGAGRFLSSSHPEGKNN